MLFIKLSPTQLIQCNNEMEVVCDHTFTPQTSKMSGETPALYKIENRGENDPGWEYEGESARSMYEYFFNYLSELGDLKSPEQFRIDEKIQRKIAQQNRVNEVNAELLDEDIRLRRTEMEVKKQELQYRQAQMEHEMLKIKLEREAILQSQARNLMPPRNLVS